jgi:hypothetical protein
LQIYRQQVMVRAARKTAVPEFEETKRRFA